MTYNPAVHHRHSTRLPGYDYAQGGAYFVTLVVHRRSKILGKIVNAEMQLSEIGFMVANEWRRLALRFPFVHLDEYVIMPDHLHGVLLLDGNDARDGDRDRMVRARQEDASRSDKSLFASPLHASPLHASPLPTDSPLHAPPLRDATPRHDTLNADTPLPDGPSSDPSPTSVRARQVEASRSDEYFFASPLQGTSPHASPLHASLLPDTPPHATPPHAATPHAPARGSLGALMAAYKTTTARLANGLRRTPGAPFWLRNYYEHIIRGEDDLLRIRAYMAANPARWADDAHATPWSRP